MAAEEEKRLILVLDDDEAVRDSMEALLGNRGFRVRTFGAPGDFMSGLEQMTERACLLLDIRMPGVNGMDVLSTVVEKKVSLAVVMITGHADVPTAVKAMKTGAVDFIEKPFTQDTILGAVEKAFDSFNESAPTSVEVQRIKERFQDLSPRDRDVFERLVDGLSNKEIARELDISPRTVEVYRAGVMEKMSAKNLSALVKMGLAAGMGKAL